jgi:hypothetical protein
MEGRGSRRLLPIEIARGALVLGQQRRLPRAPGLDRTHQYRGRNRGAHEQELLKQDSLDSPDDAKDGNQEGNGRIGDMDGPPLPVKASRSLASRVPKTPVKGFGSRAGERIFRARRSAPESELRPCGQTAMRRRHGA